MNLENFTKKLSIYRSQKFSKVLAKISFPAVLHTFNVEKVKNNEI